MNGTGGGFVFRVMKPEFCVCDYLPQHCFAFDLEAAGGAWLDAPYYLPAGSTVKEEFSLADRPTILSRAAWRDGDCL